MPVYTHTHTHKMHMCRAIVYNSTACHAVYV